MPKIAVVYYSATGNVHALARALVEGAEEAGAEVRLRKVKELAPEHAIGSRPDWRRHLEETTDVPVAIHDDLRWADAYAFGTPTRYGNVSAQLKEFLDSTGPLWQDGVFADKPATAFTSAAHVHGGNESTLLALYQTMHHWGSIIVSPGYTDEAFNAAGGNPYGTSHASADGLPGTAVLESARQQGARLVSIARLLNGEPAARDAVA